MESIREGRVTITEKGTRLYLRVRVDNKNRWYSTGCRANEIEKVRLLARELSLDVDRYVAGLSEFPHNKWQGAGNRKRNKNGANQQHANRRQDDASSRYILSDGCVGMVASPDLGVELSHLRNVLLGNSQTGKEERKVVAFGNGKEEKEITAMTEGISTAIVLDAIASCWETRMKSIDKLAVSTQTVQKSTDRMIVRMIKDCQSSDDIVESIRSWIVDNIAYDTANRCLSPINEAFASLGLAPIKLKRKTKSHIEVFTEQERNVLCASNIDSFGFNTRRVYYRKNVHHAMTTLLFVRFCFYTGCRLGEAAGLSWDDITDTQLYFHRKVSYDNSQGNILVEGLKTQKARLFPVNNQLSAILDDIKAYPIPPNWNGTGTSNRLLFVNWEGNVFSLEVLTRFWKKLLANNGIRHRKPYAMRHTFITQCLTKGIPVATVAKWVGNSPPIIYKHYAGSMAMDVPEL